jgi:hypothetical protein
VGQGEVGMGAVEKLGWELNSSAGELMVGAWCLCRCWCSDKSGGNYLVLMHANHLYIRIWYVMYVGSSPHTSGMCVCLASQTSDLEIDQTSDHQKSGRKGEIYKREGFRVSLQKHSFFRSKKARSPSKSKLTSFLDYNM